MMYICTLLTIGTIIDGQENESQLLSYMHAQNYNFTEINWVISPNENDLEKNIKMVKYNAQLANSLNYTTIGYIIKQSLHYRHPFSSQEEEAKLIVSMLKSESLYSDTTQIWYEMTYDCIQTWNQYICNCSSSLEWMQGVVSNLNSMGVYVGIYTQKSGWQMYCNAPDSYSDFPLFYIDEDNNPSFDRFEPFSGWTAPYAKHWRMWYFNITRAYDYEAGVTFRK